MPRYDLPPELAPEEERAILAAVERALEATRGRPPGWALAGRIDNLRIGALQARRAVERPWGYRADFARRGTESLIGRGDAK